MVIVEWHFFSNICVQVLWREFAVVYRACQRRKGIRSMSVLSVCVLRRGRKTLQTEKPAGLCLAKVSLRQISPDHLFRRNLPFGERHKREKNIKSLKKHPHYFYICITIAKSKKNIRKAKGKLRLSPLLSLTERAHHCNLYGPYHTPRRNAAAGKWFLLVSVQCSYVVHLAPHYLYSNYICYFKVCNCIC